MERSVVRRRMGVESSEVRASLIEAASQILREEGGAAVTARRIAEKVGLKRQIVHYYFGTIEDLIIAILQREEAITKRAYEKALQCDEPLRVIRKIGIDASVRVHEFAALAFRHDAIRVEYIKSIQAFRRLYVEALTRHLEQRGLQSNVPLVVVTTVIQAVSQALASESMLGATEGHDEINAFIEDWLVAFAERGVSPSVHH